MAKPKTIASFKHRIKLCTQSDVATVNGELALSREIVLAAWASIEAKEGSMFTRDGGFAIGESNTRQTHVVCMRYRRDMDITQTAWIYEERLQSSPRWFKVLSVKDDCDKWYLKCRLYQRDDVAIAPDEPTEECPAMPGSAMPLPPGVIL